MKMEMRLQDSFFIGNTIVIHWMTSLLNVIKVKKKSNDIVGVAFLQLLLFV